MKLHVWRTARRDILLCVFVNAEIRAVDRSLGLRSIELVAGVSDATVLVASAVGAERV